jgi:hypothetical protein
MTFLECAQTGQSGCVAQNVSFTGAPNSATIYYRSFGLYSQEQSRSSAPWRGQKVPQGLRNGTPRAVVHSMQMEKGLHSLRRVKQMTIPHPNVYVYILLFNTFREKEKQPLGFPTVEI